MFRGIVFSIGIVAVVGGLGFGVTGVVVADPRTADTTPMLIMCAAVALAGLVAIGFAWRVIP